MSNNVALDSWHLNSPLSNLSTPSQADESASTTNDRIFFGPIQSPEKKYAIPTSGNRFRTPVRRSTRLSAAMVPLPLFPESIAEGDSTREGTPDEDALPDEPSIILASRVLSACSNPSPPPSPPPTVQQALPEFDHVQLVDVTERGGEQDADLSTPRGPLIALEGLSEPAASASPFLPPPAITSSNPPDDHADLINFDSFSAAAPVHTHVAIASLHTADSTSTPSRLAPKSVDDLLSMSPHPTSTSSAQAERVVMQKTTVDNETTVTSHEEMGVTIHEVEPRASSPPLIEMTSPQQEAASDSITVANETTVPNKEQSPPLRRSTRPRRSRTSLPQTVTKPSPKPIAPKNQVDTETTYDLDTTPQTQRDVRNAEPSPALEGEGDQATVDVPATPKNLAQLACVHRELGSLSPMSAAVLTQLLPRAGDSASGSSTPLPPPLTQDSPPLNKAMPMPVPTTPPQQTTSFVFPKVGPSGDSGDAPRPKSPLRPFSPSKFPEGLRTPARRVPIAQAIADGTYSLQKLPGFAAARSPNAPSSPVLKTLALDDPNRSPARRVPISEALPVPPPSPSRVDKGKSKAVFGRQSPVRVSSVPSRERSASAEPQPVFGRKVRGTSAEPSIRPPALGRRPLFQKPASSDGTSSSSLKPRTVLPFPLTQQHRLPPAIPEAEEPGSSAARTAAAVVPVSPAKPGSSLRQPSAGSGSKIPRIGAKPYARPRAGTIDAVPSKLPTPAKARIVTKAKPLRIVNVGSSSSGSSSDEGQGSSLAPKYAGAPLSKQQSAPAAQSSTSSDLADTGPAHGLKRKRELEAFGTKPSAPGAQSVLVMRKVVPGMFNKGKEAAPGPLHRALPTPGGKTALSSPLKPSGPIKARSALDWKKPQPEGHQPPVIPSPSKAKAPSPEDLSAETVPPPVVVQPQLGPAKEPRASTPPMLTPAPDIAPSPAPVRTPTAIPVLAPAEEPRDKANEAPVPELLPQPPVKQGLTSQTQRRSGRSKRAPAPSTDVFGSVVSTTSARPLHSRRRAPFPSETAGPFAGMTALALKTLTSANTIRNQQQVVTIQTEVVRKEGSRPDSPTTRVRSAFEKQKEERAQQRKERAERRARRSAGSDLDIPPGDGATGDETGMGGAEGGNGSFMSVDHDEDSEDVSNRHRRGPGDESDYETPPRPERPAKRGRFEGGEDVSEERDQDLLEKRVKWDKGLYTTVFLNNTPPKPKWNIKAVPSQKSCLTPAAKALRLDTLGNVLNAEAPLGGLVKENVVVKKFVFDDDAVPEVANPEPPPVPSVKSTRSKSRKAKT